jgi:hypothetical protein
MYNSPLLKTLLALALAEIARPLRDRRHKPLSGPLEPLTPFPGVDYRTVFQGLQRRSFLGSDGANDSG